MNFKFPLSKKKKRRMVVLNLIMIMIDLFVIDTVKVHVDPLAKRAAFLPQTCAFEFFLRYSMPYR